MMAKTSEEKAMLVNNQGMLFLRDHPNRKLHPKNLNGIALGG
jgi:hypothetical protein